MWEHSAWCSHHVSRLRAAAAARRLRILRSAGLVAVLPLLAAMFAAYTNGSVGPNPDIVTLREDGVCLDQQGEAQLCCTWVPEAWVPIYMSAAGVVMSWTSLLVFTIRLYTISGATAQW